jgi:CubicO group peptidase (beta-lactamase class C family)
MSRVVPFVLSILFAVSSRVAAGELPRDQPEVVGLSQKTLDEVQPGFTKLVADNKIAGAVALVARHGKVAYVATVGYRDLAKKTPMTEDTIFAIASMSKPITCVAAMMLVEEGKLNWLRNLFLRWRRPVLDGA